MYSHTLVSLYETAQPAIRRRGRSWYPEIRRRLQTIGDEHDRPLAQTAAVFAITSMDAQLATNLIWTQQVLAGERAAGRYPAFQTPLIEAALSSRYPGRFVRGPKCSAFYRAIMGDTSSLVLDRWSIRAAGVVRQTRRRDIGAILRGELTVAYQAAAEACEETVRGFQAITWILMREQLTYADGRSPRLMDITI